MVDFAICYDWVFVRGFSPRHEVACNRQIPCHRARLSHGEIAISRNRCNACHAVLGATNRAVCAINDKREGRELRQRFFEVVGFSFWQAEFAFEGSFEDGCKAMSPNTSLWLAHPKEECHDVKGRVSLEPKENEKEFITRGAQNGISPCPQRALTTRARSEHRSRLLGSKPCFVKGR